MRTPDEREMWCMSLVIYHDRSFGHRLELITQSRLREPLSTPVGQWKGLGIPKDLLEGARAFLDACFSDHVITTYGIQDQLEDLSWSDREPF